MNEEYDTTEIASFEGPESYWSLKVAYFPETDETELWVFGADDEPEEAIQRGIARWESYEKRPESDL